MSCISHFQLPGLLSNISTSALFLLASGVAGGGGWCDGVHRGWVEALALGSLALLESPCMQNGATQSSP